MLCLAGALRSSSDRATYLELVDSSNASRQGDSKVGGVKGQTPPLLHIAWAHASVNQPLQHKPSSGLHC